MIDASARSFYEGHMNAPNKRDRLVEAAATLFHKKGMAATSLADIAKEADIPIGNVYYYFKAKEELALAAIYKRKEQYLGMFAMLDESIEDPRERLIQAIGLYDKVRDEFTRYGCPIGKIVQDAEADNASIVKAAAEVFAAYLHWAELQFRQLGHAENANIYAASMLSSIQGAILLAKALNNPELISQEIIRLSQFIEQLPNKKITLGKIRATANA